MSAPNVASERVIAAVGSTTAVRLELVVEWPVEFDLQELVDAVPEDLADAQVVSVMAEGQCRVCGCTDSRACSSPLGVSTCGWAEPGLCSFCAPREGQS